MGVIGRLTRLTGFVRAQLGETFRAHDLDSPTFDVLATLRRNEGPLTPKELTASSMVSSGAITQRLDRLESLGLVVRKPSDTDGRSLRVELTEAGLALVDRVLPDHLATERRILSSLTAEQQDELAMLLRILLESLGDTVD
ncbi:MAG TPA: MarR family transcriptional regulator [Candidatus Stackebrandtia excrementipullorum]|nr:MarR family transcriptional regulator [Candidatus Stackebrandtia excrementipullorum]